MVEGGGNLVELNDDVHLAGALFGQQVFGNLVVRSGKRQGGGEDQQADGEEDSSPHCTPSKIALHGHVLSPKRHFLRQGPIVLAQVHNMLLPSFSDRFLQTA